MGELNTMYRKDGQKNNYGKLDQPQVPAEAQVYKMIYDLTAKMDFMEKYLKKSPEGFQETDGGEDEQFFG